MKLLIASHACALPMNQQMFALAAKERGWQVTMVLPDPWLNEYGKSMPSQLLEGFDAELIGVPVAKNGSVPLHFYRTNTYKLLRRVRPDVIYSHNEAYALSTMQWCWANKRYGSVPFGFFSCQNLAKRYPPPFRQGESWVYRNSSFFFPITQAVDQVHRQKGYRAQSTILPLGYDPHVYHTTQDIASRHQSHTGPVRIGYVGRMVEEKGLITLAKTLALLTAYDWRLMMVGSGPYEKEVRTALDQAQISDRVEWRGFVPHAEAAQLFESVDLLVLPSETRPNWKEQFGRVMIESMACGTPVVGSDSGEIPTIIHSTRGGAVFREGDVNDFARQLLPLIVNAGLRAALAVSGEKYVVEHYSLPQIVNRFANTIEAQVA